MKTRAVVIIPTYKKELDIFEQISLKQVVRILANHPIVFVAPRNLEFDYGKECEGVFVEKFPDCYFKNTKTYSELLLSSMFYERFQHYEYMLIYQLDAFVFSDCLEEFCSLGYDYIGAPINEGGWKKYHVGNGGLSLRNIPRTLKLLECRDEIMEGNPLAQVFWEGEDNFYAYCGQNPEIDYTVPSVFTAARFSAQNDVGHGLRDISKRGLPFGTHHWPTMNYNVWKPFIEQCGYDLPGIREVHYRDYLEEDYETRLFGFIKRYLRRHPAEQLKLLKETYLHQNSNYMIWGAGFHGKRCFRLLEAMSLDVKGYCDKNAEHINVYSGVSVVYPTKSKLENSIIIVAVQYSIQEIEAELKSMGFVKGEDYFLYFDVLQDVKNYMKKNTPALPGITCPITVC